MVSYFVGTKGWCSEGLVVWSQEEETLLADDIMMQGLSVERTYTVADTLICCVTEHTLVCVQRSAAMVICGHGVWGCGL